MKMKIFWITLVVSQLFVWNNEAFVSHHTFTKRKNTFHRKCNRDKFDIPKLEDEVTCGGRDIVTHIKYLHRSVLDLTGRGIFERMNVDLNEESSDADIYKSICRNDRYVLISHGDQKDPVYNFGNSACLQAFGRSWDNLTSMPSRLCVVSKSQDEALRIELMYNVTNYGYVDGAYRGYRVRGDRSLIKLTECCVWNCYDNDEQYIGQAALFDQEKSPIVDWTDI